MSGSLLKETKEEIQLNTIEEAVENIKAGKVIIVVDDEDRENEGDFICAAECITPEIINFMSKNGRGLICTPLDERRINDLGLEMMASSNTSLHETAFTVSVDLIGHGCTTGISAYDRATGIKALVNPEMKAHHFAKPGHIFPLKAKTGGVLRRPGHTEASIDLARLAGFSPAGVLVEILDDDGSAARLPKLMKIAKKFGVKIISIKDLIQYRMRTERMVEREMSVRLNTHYGDFEAITYRQITTGDIHLALKKGYWEMDEAVPVRVHSSSGVGHIFGALFDDYNISMIKALETIEKEGKGVLIIMRHSEKNDDILTKLDSLRATMPDQHATHAKVNTTIKDFGVGAQILRELDVTKLRLLTRNPNREIALSPYGLEIVETISI